MKVFDALSRQLLFDRHPSFTVRPHIWLLRSAAAAAMTIDPLFVLFEALPHFSRKLIVP
jgi:hypothetical protein